MSEEKSVGQELSEKLTYVKKNAFEEADAEKLAAMMEYADGYMKFLDAAKTEREAVEEAVKMAEAAEKKNVKIV